MIQFSRNGTSNLPEGCLADHLEEGRCFYLPNALAVSGRDGGVPDFRLVRYGGDTATVSGGFLCVQFELRRDDLDELTSAAPDMRWELVSFEAASARLLVRSRTSDQAFQEGTWHPVVLSGNRQLRLTAHLASADTSLLASLLSQGAESVELEVALRYRGLVPGIAGSAVIESAGFLGRLRPLVAGRELRLDEVVAAYLSVPTDGTVVFRSLETLDATLPVKEVLMEELARRSLDRFFRQVDQSKSSEPLYRLVEPEEQLAESCAIALHTARTEQAEHRLAWSVSELHNALIDPQVRAAHFPVVGEVSPFSDRRVSVTNSLPFDPAFLRRVVVDVRYTGPTGTFEHTTFRFPEDGEFREIRTRFPSINTGFELETRTRLLLMPPDGIGWPTFWPGEAPFVREDADFIEMTAERTKVVVCRVAVDAGAFARASRIACILKDQSSGENEPELAAVDLTAGRAEAAIVIPDPSASMVPGLWCLAFPPDGQPGMPLPLVTEIPCPSFLQIPAHRLEVLEPDTIRARLSPGARTGVMFGAVAFKYASDPETSEGQLRTFSLTEEEPTVVWKAWRRSVFEPVQYLHRSQFVLTDESGRSLPMWFGDWIAASEHELVIELPGEN